MVDEYARGTISIFQQYIVVVGVFFLFDQYSIAEWELESTNRSWNQTVLRTEFIFRIFFIRRTKHNNMHIYRHVHENAPSPAC